MKKIMIIIPVLVLSIFTGAQQLQTSIKIVAGRARIAVKAIGGPFSGFASNFVFVVGLPKANADAGATLNVPTVLDATRVPGTLSTSLLSSHTYQDGTNQYYLLFYTGQSSASAPYAVGTEYDILELTWGGPQQSFLVSVMSLPDGNFSAPVDPGQWQQYLEIGGATVSDPPNTWFYSSATGTVISQATDASNGTAVVRTNSPILTILPVNLINFSGYKNGAKNSLLWSTASEENNRGFEIQRAVDGINYSAIGFVNSQALALGGNSSSTLSYTFDDNNPAGKKLYYRLRQVDIDNHSKLSGVVMIKGDKPSLLSIGGLFPNPANSDINVIIDAPKRDKLTLVVTDMAGKTVKQQMANVEIGSNTINVDIAKLAQGSYLVKLICQTSDCETAVGKFNKQ